MKKQLLVLFILFGGLYISTYSQNNTEIIPCENQLTFVENNQTFIYQERDSVYVSIGLSDHVDGEYIFDVTIDNQSSDTLNFNPEEINLFRYSHDTLAEQKVYHPLETQLILNNIDNSIEDREKKIKNNTVFSILLGVLYVSAEIAGVTGDMDYSTLNAIRLTHDITQTGLDIGRHNNEEKIYDLSYAGDYWLNGVFHKEEVLPHSFISGKIHFEVDETQVFKIDIPIGNRIYRYSFQDTNVNQENTIESNQQ